MTLLPQYVPGWMKKYMWVHFSKEITVEVSLEGSSLVSSCVKSTRYLIVIYFQGGILRPNRTVFNLMIIQGLDTLQLTQLGGSVFYWWFKNTSQNVGFINILTVSLRVSWYFNTIVRMVTTKKPSKTTFFQTPLHSLKYSGNTIPEGYTLDNVKPDYLRECRGGGSRKSSW